MVNNRIKRLVKLARQHRELEIRGEYKKAKSLLKMIEALSVDNIINDNK